VGSVEFSGCFLLKAARLNSRAANGAEHCLADLPGQALGKVSHRPGLTGRHLVFDRDEYATLRLPLKPQAHLMVEIHHFGLCFILMNSRSQGLLKTRRPRDRERCERALTDPARRCLSFPRPARNYKPAILV
jgi:hypothetical protein